MVELRLLNGLGNILFQYAYARILAEAKGYALRFESHPAADHAGQKWEGPTVDDSASYYPALNALFGGLPTLGGREVSNDPLFVITPNLLDAHDVPSPEAMIECDQRMDLIDHRRILEHPGKIVIESWLQDYKLFSPYKDEVHRFYAPRPNGDIPGTAEVVMHMRLGDYESCCNTLPLEYYQSMVRHFEGRRVVCVTDSPDHAYVDALAREPNFALYDNRDFRCDDLDESSRQVVADFLFISNTRGTLILSNSTFCWWAAFLSPAQEVMHPLMSQETLQSISNDGAMTVAVTDRSAYDPYWILDDTHPSRPDLFVSDQARWRPVVI